MATATTQAHKRKTAERVHPFGDRFRRRPRDHLAGPVRRVWGRRWCIPHRPSLRAADGGHPTVVHGLGDRASLPRIRAPRVGPRAPTAEPLGWWQALIYLVIAGYYAVIIAWAGMYTWFSAQLAWGRVRRRSSSVNSSRRRMSPKAAFRRRSCRRSGFPSWRSGGRDRDRYPAASLLLTKAKLAMTVQPIGYKAASVSNQSDDWWASPIVPAMFGPPPGRGRRRMVPGAAKLLPHIQLLSDEEAGIANQQVCRGLGGCPARQHRSCQPVLGCEQQSRTALQLERWREVPGDDAALEYFSEELDLIGFELLRGLAYFSPMVRETRQLTKQNRSRIRRSSGGRHAELNALNQLSSR